MSDLNIKGLGQWSDQGHLCLRGMDTLLKESTNCFASLRKGVSFLKEVDFKKRKNLLPVDTFSEGTLNAGKQTGSTEVLPSKKRGKSTVDFLRGLDISGPNCSKHC